MQQYMVERRQKGVLIYVLLLKGLEGIWRVFFHPFFLPFFLFFFCFSEIGFTRRRAVSLHLSMKSMWLASRTAGSFSTAPADICSWFVLQNPGAGRGAVEGRGWEKVVEKRKRGWGVGGSWGRCLRGFKGNRGRGVMESLIRFVHCIVWAGCDHWPHLTFYNSL